MDKLFKGFLLLLILFTFSCEKNPNFSITIIFGKIIDSKTDQPIQGVSISRVDHCSTSPIDKITFITQTDKDGKFELKQALQQSTYPTDGCSSYFVANYKGYYSGRPGFIIGAITESNIKLVKNAYLKIHLKNAAPCSSNDSYNFWIDANSSLQSSWSFNYASMLDTTLIIDVLPNYQHFVNRTSNKCNVITTQNENIYFTSGDTVYRNILF